MTYFLDNTFPPAIAEILRALDVDCVHLQDEFPAHTLDVDWIPEVGRRDYILLTSDGRIHTRPAERIALEQAGIRAFFLFAEYPQQLIWKQVAFIVEHWPEIEKVAQRLQPGQTRYINANAKILTFDELKTKRKK